jgi:hypothetical protein
MRKLYLFAAMAAMLASCSENDLSAEKQVVQQNADDGAVMFSAYVNRGTTRAGDTGELTTDNTTTPKISLKNVGFGVFGYYTDGKPYSETSTPDFMYNQKVDLKSGANWSYTPLKYWPNEFGTSAESEGQDKLTFFAYAPYVTVIPGTGRIDTEVHGAENALTSGIVGMTSNTATGDPYVKYYVDFDPENRVDLCWGVAKTAFTSSVDGNNNSVDAGAPYIDVIKPKIADRINFDFKHALAALNVQIDADVDVVSHANSTLDNKTKIWVRSVTFEGFTDKGSLNLNAKATEGPLWYELSSTNTRIGSGSVTIFDGRRDGKEGQTNAEASNEKPNQLNPQIVQSRGYAQDALPNFLVTTIVSGKRLSGVPATASEDDALNLFNSDTRTAPIYVIPTDDDLKITIVYDVETYDPNVAGYLSDGVTKGSSIQNAITKEIKMSGSNFKLEAGKVYTVKLHLGMTSVKFDASVTAWEDQSVEPTDLPINARSIFVTPDVNTCTAAKNTIGITVKDQANAAVSVATNTAKTLEQTTINGVTSSTSVTGWTWATPSFEIPANTELYKKVYALQITKTDGGYEYPSNIFSVTQAAGAITYSTELTSINKDATQIDLAANITSGQPLQKESASVTDWTEAAISIKVGDSYLTRINTGTPTADAKQFVVATDGKVTVSSGTFGTAGVAVVIEIEAGDAPKKTLSATVVNS